MRHGNETLSVKIGPLDDLFPWPIVLLLRLGGFVILAAVGQVGLFYGADVCGHLGYPAVREAYLSAALFFYAPGIRLFWLLAKPAPFDILYGVLGMFFILATYSVLLGTIAPYSYDLAGRAIRRAFLQSNGPTQSSTAGGGSVWEPDKGTSMSKPLSSEKREL
jgi:hypothetical protein